MCICFKNGVRVPVMGGKHLPSSPALPQRANSGVSTHVTAPVLLQRREGLEGVWAGDS